MSAEGLPPLALLLWAANAVFDTAGQLLLKAAAVERSGPSPATQQAEPQAEPQAMRWQRMAQRPWLWLGVACFVIEFGCWLAFLSLVPLSEGVLLGSINIVVVMIVGRVLFAERLTPLRLTGMLLIAGGVAAVGVGA